MRAAKDEHEAGVNDDLTQIMGTRDKVKQRSVWNGVGMWALDLQLGKYFVCLKLQVPGGQEHETEEPAVQGQGQGRKAWDGGAGEPRGFTDISSCRAEVVSVADNVVCNVHG